MPESGAQENNVAALQERIALLEKINKALMGRVERSVDSAGNSFSLFESNILLQNMVNERTRQLEQTNVRLMAEIRERREAEERIRQSLQEKEVLLKEVHHRVKNNLQIITSLLNLQAAKVVDNSTQRLIRDSQSRIKSMALIHEKLYRSDTLSEIDFRDYVNSLSTYLLSTVSGNRGRITISEDIDPIRVGVDIAVPCGLILTELVTNSIKYAFPDDRRGTVLISCKLEDSSRLRLTVEDDGVGIGESIDISATNSLGLQLVNGLVNQLGATLSLDTSSGTKFSIRIALEKTSCKQRTGADRNREAIVNSVS